jgi:hypothetical protein
MFMKDARPSIPAKRPRSPAASASGAARVPPDAYRAFADRAIEWLGERLHHFGFPRSHDASVLPLVKPIGELAILCDLLLRHPKGSRFHELGVEWLERAWGEIDEGRLLTTLIARRPDLIYRVSTYIPFYRNGFRSKTFENTVRRVLRVQGITALEYFGWPGLEIAVSLDELGIDPPARWTPARSFRETWLHQCPEPASITESAAYSLSHTVFYLTAFGQRPQRLPVKHRRYVSRWAPVWGEYYYRKQHWDLMSEMVMVLRCLGQPDNRDWSSRLCAAQEASGLVPGPTGDGRHLDPRCTDPERNHFLENYHPTLVGLMAALLSLEGPPEST